MTTNRPRLPACRPPARNPLTREQAEQIVFKRWLDAETNQYLDYHNRGYEEALASHRARFVGASGSGAAQSGQRQYLASAVRSAQHLLEHQIAITSESGRPLDPAFERDLDTAKKALADYDASLESQEDLSALYATLPESDAWREAEAELRKAQAGFDREQTKARAIAAAKAAQEQAVADLRALGALDQDEAALESEGKP